MRIATYYIILITIILEVILFIASWIGSVMLPDGGINSLLSAGGIRWFIGEMTTEITNPLLLWIILIGMTGGITKHSGILPSSISFPSSTLSSSHRSFNERLARQVSILLTIVLVAVVLYLVLAPHAVLLSATGTIVGSSFAIGFVPIVCFIVTAIATTYGVLASSIKTVTAYFDALLDGLHYVAPYIILYLALAQLFFSIRYVFV